MEIPFIPTDEERETIIACAERVHEEPRENLAIDICEDGRVFVIPGGSAYALIWWWNDREQRLVADKKDAT